MKISLNWLNEYLDRPATAEEVQERLTASGFPVETVEAVNVARGGSDTRLDVEITSNRGDCLSHIGLARELAAATDRTLCIPGCDLPEPGDQEADQLASLDCREPALCPLYVGRVITGVSVGPSPVWLQNRLEAAGLRSVNNVVDVTNFVLLEMGQPLHAFDLGQLVGRRVIVRRASQSERFIAIDASRHVLTDRMLVIADGERPVAVAGVMGGKEPEVGATTRDIFLESAMFDPLSVRRTSRALKLSSDSSYRFERGVDPLGVEAASRRAAGLIVELAGGTLAAGVLRTGQADDTQPRQVSMRVNRANQLLGLDLRAGEQAKYLERLELSPRVASSLAGDAQRPVKTDTRKSKSPHPSPLPEGEGVSITCTLPSFRDDLRREADLIEEVGRLHGFDKVTVHDRLSVTIRPPQPGILARQRLGQVLMARGYHEAITFSLVSPRDGQPFIPQDAQAVMLEEEGGKDTSPLARPPVRLTQERRDMLRPSVLPSLLSCRKLNQDAGNVDARLFEVASTWIMRADQIVETLKLALIRDAGKPQAALRELRGAIETLVERLGGSTALAKLTVEESEAPNFAAAATVALAGESLGMLGLLDQAALDQFDVKTPIVAGELDVQPVLALYPPPRQVHDLPRYPAIERDLSVVVDEAIRWRQIEDAVRQTKPAQLESLTFVDAYRGKPIAGGSKSVTLRMTFRDADRTLRHEEVDPQVQSVVEALSDQLAAELRG